MLSPPVFVLITQRAITNSAEKKIGFTKKKRYLLPLGGLSAFAYFQVQGLKLA